MVDNVLYIIGNGFDLHHGVASSYASFCKWLKKHDFELYDLYETVCSYDALWSDFETSMAYVDRDYFLAAGEAMLPDSGSYNIVVFLTICISYANNCFTL